MLRKSKFLFALACFMVGILVVTVMLRERWTFERLEEKWVVESSMGSNHYIVMRVSNYRLPEPRIMLTQSNATLKMIPVPDENPSKSANAAAHTFVRIRRTQQPYEFVPSDLMPDIITRDQQIVINPKHLCKIENNLKVFLMIMILSAVKHFEARSVIRKTYGGVTDVKGNVLRHVFLLGKTDDVTAMEQVRKESIQYGDIAQFDFNDTYRNLTLKSCSGLMWCTRFCSARFFLKTDDDIIVYPERVVGYLEKLTKDQEFVLYTGRPLDGGGITRNKKNRFYVPYGIYPYVRYPDYIGGLGILMSERIVQRFYFSSYKIVRTPSEDVYLGLLAKTLGIFPTCNKGVGYEIKVGRSESSQRIFCHHYSLMVALVIPEYKRNVAWTSYVENKDKDIASICNPKDYYDNQDCRWYEQHPDYGIKVHSIIQNLPNPPKGVPWYKRIFR
jgi:hypothetical protein